MEQAVDRTAHQTVTEVVERALVLLEVGGAQAVADYHVVSFGDLLDHGGCRVGWVGVIAVGHDVHIGVDVFEHGSDHVAFALAWLLADDGPFRRRDLGGAVGGVVVVHVDVRLRQRDFKITHDLADGDFFVVARKKYRNGNVRILRHALHYISCTGLHGEWIIGDAAYLKQMDLSIHINYHECSVTKCSS